MLIKKSTGTHWILLFIDRNTALYSDSFVIEYISREVLNKIKDKLITHNIFRKLKIMILLCVDFVLLS